MTSQGLSSLLWFVAILAAIPAVLWFLKRTPLGGAGSGQAMRSIGVLPLSTSQRIVTLEVGSGDERRWLVLGVTPTTITTLHMMAPQGPAAVDAAMPPAPPFAALLARLRRSPGDGDAR